MLDNVPSLTGDVIMFKSSKKGFNVVAQSFLRGKRAGHSHVAIAVKQGNAIHAMPGTGVQLQSIRELFLDKDNDLVVFRNSSLECNEKALCRLEDSLLFYQRQAYNYGLFVNRSSCASFCSELAANAYEKIGSRLSGKRPNSTLPVDIYECISSDSDWREVTDEYKSFFLDECYATVHDVAAEFVRNLEYANQGMARGQQLMLDQLRRAEAKNGAVPRNLQPTRDYWSNNGEGRIDIIFALRMWWGFLKEGANALYRFLFRKK